MIIWSIHPLEFFQKLEKNKVIFPNKKKLSYSNEFLDSYHWMATQMDKKIGGRPHPTAVPFWGWYQWQNEQVKRPDLRVRAHLQAGTRGVRMELDIPDDQVVLSDFMLWCDVLNKWYIANNLRDSNKFFADTERMGMYDSWTRRLQIKAEKSWYKVFDMSFHAKGIASPRYKKAIQATFWKISLNQVKDVKFFTARKPAF
jgi:Domain of unknown function (DUF3841)